MKIEGLSDAEKAKAVELTADVEKDIRASIGDEIVDVFKKAVDETY
jgi:hypothetical protein